MLAFEQFAFVRLQLVLQSGPPLRQRHWVISWYFAQVAAKARFGSLTGRLWAASRNALGDIIATAHQRDQDHAVAIQPRGPVLGLEGVVDVDVGGRLARLLWRPIADCDSTSKHERVDILAQDRIDYALALQQGALGLSLARRKVDGESKLLQQLLGEELGDGGDVGSRAFVPFEGGLVGAIEDEDGVDGKCDQAQEAVVECSKGRVGSTCGSQRLLMCTEP